MTMQKDLAKTLLEKMTKLLDYRSGQIGNRLQVMEALLPGAGKAVYQQLYELSGQVELLCKELRETMTEFYDDLQLTGVWPVLRPYPFATQVKATVEKDCVRLVLPEMLPFPIGGSVYYLHEQVKMALEKLIPSLTNGAPWSTCTITTAANPPAGCGITTMWSIAASPMLWRR